MQIETKFNIGDEAFMLNACRILKVKIKMINVFIDKDVQIKVENLYEDMAGSGGGTRATDDFLFKTKEELVERLLETVKEEE